MYVCIKSCVTLEFIKRGTIALISNSEFSPLGTKLGREAAAAFLSSFEFVLFNYLLLDKYCYLRADTWYRVFL